MRGALSSFHKRHTMPERWIEHRGQQAADRIGELLRSGKPCMVARIGGIELSALIRIRQSRHTLHRIFNKNKREKAFQALQSNTGFFPLEPHTLERFHDLMCQDLGSIDILGSWRRREWFFRKELRQAVKIPLEDIEPYLNPVPWTQALHNRKVLVVHPFSESIQEQYRNRELLFKNNDILPQFELITLKAVQTIAGTPTPFRSWFEALDSMQQQIAAIDFDVAILGCGAYGLPLAAAVKQMRKQAVHMGGPTQILFGIKGKRWESNPRIAPLMNEHWIRPKPSETPQRASTIEGGCYW